jgi:RHS repeat-associated protein
VRAGMSGSTVLTKLEYYPYGEVYSMSGGGSVYTFLGKEDPGVGMLDFGPRYYNALLGRFLSPDPILAGASAYSYAEGNPVMFYDPDGMRTRYTRPRWISPEERSKNMQMANAYARDMAEHAREEYAENMEWQNFRNECARTVVEWAAREAMEASQVNYPGGTPNYAYDEGGPMLASTDFVPASAWPEKTVPGVYDTGVTITVVGGGGRGPLEPLDRLGDEPPSSEWDYALAAMTAGVSVAAGDIFNSDLSARSFAMRAAGKMGLSYVATAVGIEAQKNMKPSHTRGHLLVATGTLSLLGGAGMTLRGVTLAVEVMPLAPTVIGGVVVGAIAAATLTTGYIMIDEGIDQISLGGSDLGYW